MQTNVVIPLPRDNLFGLIGNVTSNAINIFERKLSVKGAVRAGKGFFFFNEDIKIIKSLEDLGVLIVLVIFVLAYTNEDDNAKRFKTRQNY